MIKKELVERPVEEVISITCDRCKVEIQTDDTFEIQEMLNLNFVAGFGADLGDGNRCKIDLCQKCVKEVLGPWLRVTESSLSFG